MGVSPRPRLSGTSRFTHPYNRARIMPTLEVRTLRQAESAQRHACSLPPGAFPTRPRPPLRPWSPPGHAPGSSAGPGVSPLLWDARSCRTRARSLVGWPSRSSPPNLRPQLSRGPRARRGLGPGGDQVSRNQRGARGRAPGLFSALWFRGLLLGTKSPPASWLGGAFG